MLSYELEQALVFKKVRDQRLALDRRTSLSVSTGQGVTDKEIMLVLAAWTDFWLSIRELARRVLAAVMTF